MISIEAFISVLTIWTVAVVTPGPNFFITARTATAASRLSAFFVVLGICTGTMIWGMSGFLGLTVLFMISPWIYLVVRVAGGIYLLYLGVTFLMKAYRPAAKIDVGDGALSGAFSNWRLGLITILSNPKTAIFVTSLFASALPPEAPALSGILSVLLMVVISLIWYSLVMLLFSSAAVLKGYQGIQRWMDGIAGTVFIGFGAKLILDRSPP